MSTVSTSARSSRSLTMAASSEVSWPTSTRGSDATGRPASALCRSAWLILAAQPAKRASSVRRGTVLSTDAGFGGVATVMESSRLIAGDDRTSGKGAQGPEKGDRSALDDADMAVGLHVGCLDTLAVLQPLLAQLGHQLLDGDEFGAHVPAQHAPVLDQLELGVAAQTFEGGKPELQPFDAVAPEQHGGDQHGAFDDRLVLRCDPPAGHLGNKDDHEDIGRADAADLAPQHDAQQHEDHEIHDRAAQEEFQQGMSGREDRVPVDVQQLIHIPRGAVA